ncbi:microtubule associated protein-domain-containing protein [Amylostereum chailletii]|nr:microtubule associated protein-domain-containing protein [Amylostereum chailletii]
MSSQPSITSLLNSLHSHLQSQTQLLPTLHAQLGLPPTALADELSALQQSLTQCVEDQIDGRRRQVEEWMTRCSAVEEECQSYGIALGSNVKGAGNTVGELRKEHVLPRRYEMLTELQEKLRQLYHTKLEQLLTLSNRVAALSRTLPEGFFSDDLLAPLGAASSSSHREVTPERFSKLEKELVRGKGEVTKRLSSLSATFVQIDWLYQELGISPPEVEDLPSSAGSASSLGIPPTSRPPSSLGSSSSDPFLMSTPTPGSRTKPITPAFLFPTSEHFDPDANERAFQRIFARFAVALEEADDEALLDGRTIGLEGVEPSPGLLAWADGKRVELENIKRQREAHIQAMYDQLEGLWRRLGVPDEAMDGFVEAHRGSTEETVREYEEELERMLELKRERMSTFVENARAEIERLWEELMVGEDERADFVPFYDDEHTEELLIIHEDEIKRLKEERMMKAHLLASIRKYFEICDEEKELASAASDQSRLLGRGPRDPGRLLREEKMRKRVRKEKPRLEQDLLASIPAWEAEAGRPFQVHGESLLQILLEASAANGKENKQAKPGQRAGSVPARATTPNSATSDGPAPRNGRGVVTPAVRSASSMGHSQSVPNKRPRLGDSAGTNTGSFAPTGPHTSHKPATLSSSHSASKIAMPVPVRATGLGASSSLPRPVVVPRPGTQHHALGHGRVPSAQQERAVSGGMPRSTSAQRGLGVSTSYRGYASSSTLGCSVNDTNPKAAARKASRARRESFKPRPSVEGTWALGVSGQYGGFPDAAVKEEDGEDE